MGCDLKTAKSLDSALKGVVIRSNMVYLPAYFPDQNLHWAHFG